MAIIKTSQVSNTHYTDLNTSLNMAIYYYYSFIHVSLHPQQTKAHRYSNMPIYNIAINMRQS
jgi:hypothetical protein